MPESSPNETGDEKSPSASSAPRVTSAEQSLPQNSKVVLPPSTQQPGRSRIRNEAPVSSSQPQESKSSAKRIVKLPPPRPTLPELMPSPIKEVPEKSDDSMDEIPHILSSLSDGDEELDGQQQQHFSPNGSAGKLVHDFFYPKRQPSNKSGSESHVHNNVTLPCLDPKITHEFEDEHAESDTHQERPTPTSPPPSAPGGAAPNRRSSTEALNQSADSTQLVEERQDKAFVESFWTAYDEILILSLFTQIGILCRLGAASFFRYFDGVFHSGSALFTNLPLNCLSCFVMGMLCSGESLMQIINTRFTPPRLQQDLHREAIQSPSHSASMEDYSSDEDMVEMELEGAASRRTRRRKKRNRMGWRRRRHRTSSLIQLHVQQQRESSVLQELREVQLLAWERRIRASVCLLLFPVRQEDVDVMESYFSDGYRQENDAGLSHLNHEEEQKVPDSEEGHWIGQGLSRDGINVHTEPLNGEGHGNDVDIGDFDDLILQEEDEETPPPSTLTSDPKTAANSLTFPAVESQETSAEAATHPTSHPVSTIEPQTGAASSYQKNASTISNASSKQGLVHARGTPHLSSRQYAQVQGGNVVDYGTENNKDLDQIITDVATGASKTISRIGRINLAEGWDVGTSPQEKSEDLCLGLRDGLCGALSSFSSWMSSMANLFRTGDIGQAFVGLILGIQLPLIAYRSGQYVSVYIFVWRCRREKRRDERRGYGLRLQTDEEGSVDDDLAFNLSAESIDTGDEMSTSASHRAPAGRTKGLRTVHDEDSEVPSVRAVITALFIMCLVAQITSLQFFYEPDDRLLALSLLFSPLGVLARWRMMKFNAWRPNFPIGTFACNVMACALSGSLGRLLAGNPGPRQSIALVAIIDGFAGTLSSVARFIVEILSLMDPILFRLDGLYYAVASAFWGLLISFIFSASGDWADSVDKES